MDRLRAAFTGNNQDEADEGDGVAAALVGRGGKAGEGGGTIDEETAMLDRGRNNSGRFTGPSDSPEHTERSYSQRIPWCVSFGDLMELEFEEVLPMVQKTRQREMVTHFFLWIAGWIFGLSVSGVGLFGKNVYGYEDSACHCVVVNQYFGHFMTFAVYSSCCLLPVVLLHDPDGGAYGPSNTNHKDSQRKSLRKVFRSPHCAMFLSLVALPLIVATYHMIVTPLAAFLTWYSFYGLAFCGLLLGICRAECDNDFVMDSGQWGAQEFVGFYASTFDPDAWPGSNGTATHVADWTYRAGGEYQPGIVSTTQMVWTFTAIFILVAWIADCSLYWRIVLRRRSMLKRRLARGFTLDGLPAT